MERHCQKELGQAVAYFYFNFNNPQKQNTRSMVTSLIVQLSKQHASARIRSILGDLYSSCQNGGHQPSSTSLVDALHDIVDELPLSWIILDALDECVDRSELLGTLDIMATWGNTSHILVTSRREHDIESCLSALAQESIALQTELVDKDIDLYISNRLETDKSLERWRKDPSIQLEIKTKLMSGAHGMYGRRSHLCLTLMLVLGFGGLCAS